MIFEEHPLRGPGGLLHNSAVDAVLQLRNRSLLDRLVKAAAAPEGVAGKPD